MLCSSEITLDLPSDSPERPDSLNSCEDVEMSDDNLLASLSIQGREYPYDPDDIFKGWPEETSMCKFCIQILRILEQSDFFKIKIILVVG